MIFRYYPLLITLRSPAILNQPGGDPNSAATMEHIPGGVLRGTLAGALGDPGKDPARLSEFRDLVLGGRVRFLNAYPADGEHRALPIPVTFRATKTGASLDAQPVTDLAAWTDPDDDWPSQALETPSFAYVSLDAAQPRAARAMIGSRIHQQRDRRMGRAWTDKQNGQEIAHGAVFAYEYMEAGQLFVALIQINGASEQECESVAQRVRRVFDSSPFLLGRSRRSGYGGDAALEWRPPREREVAGEGMIRTDVPAGGIFRLLLTSPCVVRDAQTGQLDPEALVPALLDRLNQRVEIAHRHWAFTLAGGFNRKWRLEIPQALAIAAGSVLVLRARALIQLGDLLQIEHEGIGERLAEGFGRVCFMEAASRQVRVLAPQASMPMRPGGDADDLVRFIEGRILDAAMRRAVDRQAAEIAKAASSIPSPSLLGRLRVPLRGGQAQARETLQTWCGEGDGALRRPAREQLDRCRIRANGQSQSLRGLIRSLLNGEGGDNLDRLLSLQGLAERNHVISRESAISVLQARRHDFVIHFLDAVLAAMSRLKKREV